MTIPRTTSPANTQPPRRVRRRESADQRSDGDGDRSGRADQPVGARPTFGREVPGDQRHDGRHDQRGPDPFEEGPAEEQQPRLGDSAVVSDPAQ